METETDKPKEVDVEVQDFIVTGGLDDCVKIWNVKDDKISFSKGLEGHSLGIVSVDVSSSGKGEENWQIEASSNKNSHFSNCQQFLGLHPLFVGHPEWSAAESANSWPSGSLDSRILT